MLGTAPKKPIKKPKVSAIIPTHNRAKWLPRSIRSVLDQQTGVEEVLVIDDGSTDETREAISRLQKSDSRVRYIYQENQGVSSARNLGISHAQNPWIAFLDSDDEWLPHKLKSQMELIEDQPDLLVVHGEEIWIRNGRRVNQKKKHQKYGGDIFEKCLPLCLMSPSSIVIHREVFETVGTFDEKFIVCEDYDLWLRITARYQVGFVSDPIIKKYGGHEDQLSHRYRAMDYWRVLSLQRIWDKEDTTEEQRQLIRPILLEKAAILLNGYKKHGNLENYDEVLEIQNRFQTPVEKSTSS